MTAEALLGHDAASRRRALEPGSFIVEAPAGAGKTELLTQRVLMLLARVEEPEEIVAITFTNKAAAEMRSRILESLRRAASGEVPEQAHKRITFDLARAALAASAQRHWDLLEHPGRLRVTTIDAFCASLARQMPVLSRFGAQPRLAEDAGRHYDEAARRALAWLEEPGALGEAVGRALVHLDNDVGRLAKLLAAMLARRDQWLRHALAGQAREEAEAGLQALVLGDLRAAAAALPRRCQEMLMPIARYAAANLGDRHPMAHLGDWQAPLAAEAAELPRWRALVELLLTKDGTPRSRFDKTIGLPAGKESEPYKEALRTCLAGLGSADAAALAQLRRLPDPRYTEEEWATVAALAELLKLAAGELWMVFHEAGEADFVEVARRALAALGSPEAPTDLALSLDYRIRHLLVDEFQDTSPTQVELLQELTAGWAPEDGRSLFLVGDPMQSIYRFRKADVGLFLAAARVGIGTVPLECLRLYRNNRSCAPVVDWVNATFAGVFPAADAAAAGAIRYRECAATREALPAAAVAVRALVAGREEDGEALEAAAILDLIDAERAAAPGRDIAVLVRARSHLDALVAAIRRHRPELRFTAVEIEALAARQPVQDLLSLTRALHHRADRLSWLAILRAPWCGLTLADLHVLAGDDLEATIWSLMNDAVRCSRLSADGQARLDRVRLVLGEALGQRGRQPPARWLAGCWWLLGGPDCLAGATELADCEAFFGLVERLDGAGRFSVAQLEQDIARLYGAPDAGADGSLQFMTLHKSKGLEFDTVILPGLHRKTGGNEQALMLWEELALDGLEERLVAAPLKKRGQGDQPTPYDYLAGLERQRAANESARVLYVGATRAIRRLHLVGVATRNAKGEVKAPAGTFLDLLWSAVGGEFRRVAEAAGDAEPPPELATMDFRPRLRRLAVPLARALPAPLAVLDRPRAAEPEPATATAAAAGDPLDAQVGTLTHAYLELIGRDGLAAWPAERIAALVPAMAAWFGRQGVMAAEAGLGVERVQKALLTTLASAAGRWVLARHPAAAVELALASQDETGATTHVVDRTFIDAGIRWIIDYKTATVSGSEDDLLAHAERYRPQLARYASLFREEGLPIKLAIFFATRGRLVELPR